MYYTHDCAVRIIKSGLDEEAAYLLEYETVQWYKKNTTDRLTNQTDGGNGTHGYKMTEQQKENLRQAVLKRCNDPEYIQRLTAQRRDPNGVYQSKEFREKISSIVQGKDNPNYGNHWTDEQKQSLSKKQKESKRYEGEKNPNAKPIKCVETGETFSCIKNAQDKYNVKCGNSFTVALNHPTRTAAHLHWEYI